MNYKSAVFCLLFFLPQGATMAKERKLQLYTEHFPPYNFQHQGVIQGINYELVELGCQRAKINCYYQLVSWKRAYRYAQQKKNTGVFSTSKSAERQPYFQWVGPLVSSENYFYKLKSRTDIHISSDEEAIRYTVAAPRNDIYEDVLIDMGFSANENLLGLSGKYESVKLFFSGKIDLIIASPVTLPYQMGKERELIEKVWPLQVPQLDGNYVAFNLESDPALLKKLNTAIEQLHREGVTKALIKKYITP